MKFNLALTQRCILLFMLGWISAFVYAQDMQLLPEMQTVELFPTMRPEPLTASLYNLKTGPITKFLQDVLIFDDMDQYETLPYVVGFDRNAKIGGAGDLAYTKGLHVRNDVTEFSFLAPGNELEHPYTGEKLGLEVFLIGRGIVQEFGPTQSVLITKTTTNIDINTRITPLSGLTIPESFDVKYPAKYMHGYILSIPEDRELAGQYSVVIISLGSRDGIKQGNVLDIVEGIREVSDPNKFEDVTLPSAKVGEVLVFSVKEKISLALITYSLRTIIIDDEVKVPMIDHVN